MATQKHTPITSATSPIKTAGTLNGGVVAQQIMPAGAHLFRPGYLDPSATAHLPFCSYDGNDPDHYWRIPHFADDDAGRTDAEEFGKRAAAAFFVDVMGHGPSGGNLMDIAEAMALSEHSNMAKVGFWTYINRMLWLAGFGLSAAQVAADVEAVIAETRILVAESDDAEGR